MARNFGLGSREMKKAAAFALKASARRGEISFASAATMAERFSQFATYAREHGARYLEYVTPDLVREYGRQLAEKVETGEMSASTAKNYVSAVNTVMTLATCGRWKSISPTRDCWIEHRSTIREEVPGALDREAYNRALDAVRNELGDRVAATVELMRELGLRSKEASLLDARSTLSEARERGSITISEGTKGGREREVPITSERQIEALSRAAEAQGSDRAMIPGDLNWREWREGDLREAREIVRNHTGGGLHDLRAAYACERYKSLTGWAAPVAGGEIVDRNVDREARMTIAKELGHGRIEVVSSYIGGR